MELPEGLTLQRTTPTFDETTVPAALRKAHLVADGVWGRLVVSSGSVGFVFDDDPDAVRTVSAGESQVIPPARPHHLVVDGPVTLAVEFHR
jgi:cupin 2 domain-containing protein